MGRAGFGGVLHPDCLGEQAACFPLLECVPVRGCSPTAFAGRHFFSEGMAWEAISQIEIYKGLSNCFAEQAL